MRIYQHHVRTLLAIFLVSTSAHAAQPNSRTTLSSSSAHSTTSTTIQSRSEHEKVSKTIKLGNKALKEGNRELAITYMEYAFNNSARFPQLRKQAADSIGVILFMKSENKSLEEQITEAITRGNKAIKGGNRELAITYMKLAFNNSARFPQLRTKAAANRGMLLFMRGDHVQALPHLTEAYTAISQLKRTSGYKRGQDREHILMSQTVLAGFLARVYLLDEGVKPNYEQAFKLLSQSAESANPEVSSLAKAFLGKIYIEGLGKQQDVERARKYFSQALQQAQTGYAEDNAINGLLTTIVVQIIQFNTFIKDQLTHLNRSQITNENKLKQASEKLREIQITQQMLPQNVARICTNMIAHAQEQLKQLQAHIEQKKQELQDTSEESVLVESIAKLTLTETPATSSQPSLKMLKEQATIAYEAFLKKPSAARYQEAAYALRELLPLTIDDPKLNKETLHKLGCITNREVVQQKSVATCATTKDSKAESTRWRMCDPFEQIKQLNNVSQALQTKLDQLAQDYLEVSDVKKLHGFTNLWRTRVGDLRIIYTVLPKQHAIGIVQIDQRKDVYDNIEELQKRENWFYKLDGITYLEKSLKQSETKKS